MIDQVLDGKYRIDKKLGQGGMGAVYLATHLGTERPVALKVIMPQFMANAEFVERFKREAKAAGLLRHPNVVNVTDFGFAEAEQNRIAYLVMEYLNGYSLKEILMQRGKLPLDFTVEIIEQVCSAVEEAHKQGVIHRDLKPDNIWMQPNGRGGFNVKVLDFGLAKVLSSARPDGADNPQQIAAASPHSNRIEDFSSPQSNPEKISDLDDVITQKMLGYPAKEIRSAEATSDGKLTEVGSVLGTPLYMSPEQCKGIEIDSRSDIYSLATIVYEMLAGETPFAGNSHQLVLQHSKALPPPLKTKRPDLPESISELLTSALSKNPVDRPATAAAFAGALRARAETASKVLRRAIALYSEVFPAFIRISLFANIHTIILVIVLLAIAPAIVLSFSQFAIIALLIVNSVNLTFTINRAGFAIVVEQHLLAPLSPIGFYSVLTLLKNRLGIEGSLSNLKTYLLIFAKLTKINFLHPSLTIYPLGVPAAIIEGKDSQSTNRRAKELCKRIEKSLNRVYLFTLLLYFVPITLFFFSILGISKSIGIDNSSSINLSSTAAIITMALNVVWLIPPSHIAISMLYFTARQAGGETLTE